MPSSSATKHDLSQIFGVADSFPPGKVPAGQEFKWYQFLYHIFETRVCWVGARGLKWIHSACFAL